MLAFGEAVNVHPQFDKAKVILALDCDFLGADWPTPLATKLYTRNRHVNSDEDLEKINRLYVVESQFSLTGANAEHRLRMRGAEVPQFAADLLAALSAPPSVSDKRTKFIAALAKDLKAAGKEALVVAGPRQPAVVHALAHQINQTLGAAGTTVTFTKAATADRVESGVDALKTLIGEMTGGQVSTLIILGGNPAYTAPADLQFGAALAKVANSIHLGAEDDETAAAAKWHLPEAHYLEAWGDARSTDGVAAHPAAHDRAHFRRQERHRSDGGAARFQGQKGLRPGQELLDLAVAGRDTTGKHLAQGAERRRAGRDASGRSQADGR